jgi:hypothetical protein
VRIIRKSVSKGINRVNWDLRYQSARTVEADKYDPLSVTGSGILAMPGKYSVSLTMTTSGESTAIAGPIEFNAVVLGNTTLPSANRGAMVDFHRKVAELTRVMQGTENYTEALYKRATSILQALNSTPSASPDLVKKALGIQLQLDEILNIKFNRNTAKPSSEENPPAPVPLNARLGSLSWISWSTTGDPTQTQKDAYAILEAEFPPVYEQVKRISNTDIPQLERDLELLGGPVTPGRLPEWRSK